MSILFNISIFDGLLFTRKRRNKQQKKPIVVLGEKLPLLQTAEPVVLVLIKSKACGGACLQPVEARAGDL